MLSRSRRVLIVEDQPLISIMIEEMAASLGWEAACAYTSEQALKDIEATQPALAVLDVNLGATTSAAVAVECRARRIPIVIATGLALDEVPDECGGAPVLAKPFSEVEFAQAVQQAIVQTLRHP
jgi:CheY-like chemotaxis protein